MILSHYCITEEQIVLDAENFRTGHKLRIKGKTSILYCTISLSVLSERFLGSVYNRDLESVVFR